MPNSGFVNKTKGTVATFFSLSLFADMKWPRKIYILRIYISQINLVARTSWVLLIVLLLVLSTPFNNLLCLRCGLLPFSSFFFVSLALSLSPPVTPHRRGSTSETTAQSTTPTIHHRRYLTPMPSPASASAHSPRGMVRGRMKSCTPLLLRWD